MSNQFKKYRERPKSILHEIEALKFDPTITPWPEMVTPYANRTAADKPFGYIEQNGIRLQVYSGNWICRTSDGYMYIKSGDLLTEYQEITD